MNPEQSCSSNLQNPSFGSSTDHINNTNPTHSQAEGSFSTPILSIPQPQSQQDDNKNNLMNDQDLYEYLYNPNRFIQLNSLSIFCKTQLNEVNKLKVLDSIQTNQSNGKYYEAWLKSHSNSNTHQVSQSDPTGPSALPFMEIDQHQFQSDSINHSTIDKMIYDLPTGHHNSNDLTQVDTGVDVEMSE